MTSEEIKECVKGQGGLFEEIVELFLRKEYPEYEFVHTSYHNDGGKDFFAVCNDEKIWAEAKSYDAHLSLSDIAGTFVMADICFINRIIVFSLSKLSCGALENLSKFCIKHNRTLFVFTYEDIVEIAARHKVDSKCELSELREKFPEQQTLIDDLNNEAKSTNYDECYANYGSECLELLNKVFAIKLYRQITELRRNNRDLTDKTGADKGIQQYVKYFANVNSANRTQLLLKSTKNFNVRAFDIMSVELVFRNNDMQNSKTVHIQLSHKKNQFKMLSSQVESRVTLSPGQCTSAIFYFQALNNCATIELPQPDIKIGDSDNSVLGVGYGSYGLDCQNIGEVEYLGEDKETLDRCCSALRNSGKFQTVIVYGKSGVGKSRFLRELQTSRMADGKSCFVFHGDAICNSAYDFFRQLFMCYYDFSANIEVGSIELPQGLRDCNHFTPYLTDLDFITSVFNSANKKIDCTIAQNWLTTFLKNNNVTLIVDNVQVLNSKVISILKQVISDLRQCDCGSEIVLAFNTELVLSESHADRFFHILNDEVEDAYKLEILGFNATCAFKYLKKIIDPKGLRKELNSLFRKIANRKGVTPLLLKQIIFYLHQRGVFDYSNGTASILDLHKLRSALNELPNTFFETMALRYEKLKHELLNFENQLNDLLWLIVIFGEMPENFKNCITDFDDTVLKYCLDTGFVKYSKLGTLVFDHQLIGQAVLLLLENSEYNPKPRVTRLGIGTTTAQALIENNEIAAYPAVKFVLSHSLQQTTVEIFKKFLSHVSYSKVVLPMMPYVTGLVELYLQTYNSDISAQIKIAALTKMMHKTQEKFGTQDAQAQFKKIIEFQMSHYSDNKHVTYEFLELLKFYMYELPISEKNKFLNKMSEVGNALYQYGQTDFDIWILWATGKNAMHYGHDFTAAETKLNKGLDLARKLNSNHRIAELEVQYGAIYAYKEDKISAAKHWQLAADNFGDGIYDEILKRIYQGYVYLLKNDLENANNMFAELAGYYNDRDCYAYLKSVIDNYMVDCQVSAAVAADAFNNSLHTSTVMSFDRFRSVALAYDERVYLNAAYKNIAYLKYILKNHSQNREPQIVNAEKQLVSTLSEELLANYNWGESDFNYFFPIFNDIADFVSDNMQFYDNIIRRIAADRIDLFKACVNKTDVAIAPKLKHGIFNDPENKVNLFHYSYTW